MNNENCHNYERIVVVAVFCVNSSKLAILKLFKIIKVLRFF